MEQNTISIKDLLAKTPVSTHSGLRLSLGNRPMGEHHLRDYRPFTDAEMDYIRRDSAVAAGLPCETVVFHEHIVDFDRLQPASWDPGCGYHVKGTVHRRIYAIQYKGTAVCLVDYSVTDVGPVFGIRADDVETVRVMILDDIALDTLLLDCQQHFIDEQLRRQSSAVVSLDTMIDLDLDVRIPDILN